ncbi:serine/threonine-protein kinase Sgk1 isoform X1 [Ixodes scapularis]|nr:serine/threonine-protein kinase Sgk1 isoform X1 [Ixodes scapularis]
MWRVSERGVTGGDLGVIDRPVAPYNGQPYQKQTAAAAFVWCQQPPFSAGGDKISGSGSRLTDRADRSRSLPRTTSSGAVCLGSLRCPLPQNVAVWWPARVAGPFPSVDVAGALLRALDAVPMIMNREASLFSAKFRDWSHLDTCADGFKMSEPLPVPQLLRVHHNGSSTPPLTTASVTNSEVHEKNKKFTVYKVVVTVDGHSWFVLRRYNDFSKLLDIIKKQCPGSHLKLPGKKLFGNNFSPDFIRTRRQGLDDFIQKLVLDEKLMQHPEVRAFLNVDKNLGDKETPEEEEVPGAIAEAPVDLGCTEKPHATPGDFEFLKVIGKGSFGRVMLARHKVERKLYAVKVLQKKMILKRNERNHIMSERNVLLKNLHHPFLVGLHFSFQTSDKLYFVLDYVNGGELFFHLQKERYFAEPRARFYAAEITCALSYLHSQGTMYRDLKPENILLDAQGHVVLTDFGLCKEGLREQDTTSTFCGTPEYLAPEVLRKEAYDRTVDWWCLGAVLYEMLYGLPPFYSRDTTEMYDNILHKQLKLRTNISLAARNILEGLLQKDRTLRLGHAEDGDEVKRHEFFNPIVWQDLEAKKISPPYRPNLNGCMDLKNIDPEFVREPVPASVGRSQTMSASVQDADTAFQGFSYAPPMDFH